MRTLTIQIPQPCHERWADMQPTERGRFCANCQKVVVDYTALSDQELVRLLSKPLSTNCGRFRNEQLNRPLFPAQPAMAAWRRWAGLLTMSLFGWQTARAQLNQAGSPLPASQAVVQPAFSVAEISGRSAPATYSLAVTGRVFFKDTTGTVLPMANAHVLVTGAGTIRETRTDSTGSYTVSIMMPIQPGRLRILASTEARDYGQMTVEASPQKASLDAPPLIIDRIKESRNITGGGLCIVQPPTRWQRLKRKLIR